MHSALAASASQQGLGRSWLPARDADPATIPLEMLQVHAERRPIRPQRELLRPLDNQNGRLGEYILEAKGLQIAELLEAVNVHATHPAVIGINVNPTETPTRNVPFAS